MKSIRMNLLMFVIGLLLTVGAFSVARADLPQLPGGILDDATVGCD